jgi:hypothetical protein
VAYAEPAPCRDATFKRGDVVPVRSPEANSSLDVSPPAGGGGGAAGAADPSLKVRLNRPIKRMLRMLCRQPCLRTKLSISHVTPITHATVFMHVTQDVPIFYACGSNNYAWYHSYHYYAYNAIHTIITHKTACILHAIKFYAFHACYARNMRKYLSHGVCVTCVKFNFPHA